MTREETKEAIDMIKHILEVAPKEPPTECDYVDEWLREDAMIRKSLNTAIKALEQTRWIPVSERPPKEGEEVLVSCYNTYHKKVVVAKYQGEKYGFTCGLVPAWMSLPKPYESKESEE